MILEELKGLPPEERIKKIKEIQAKQKKEQDDAEKLLKQSKEEAEESLRKSLDQQFEELESRTVQQEFEEAELEKTVREETVELTEEELQQHLDYQQQLAMRPQQDLKQGWYKLDQEVQEHGGWQYATNDQRAEARDIRGGMELKYEAAKKQTYAASEQVVESIKSVMDEITGKYENTGGP